MYYYIEENNKIILFNEDKTTLENTINFTPQYKEYEIQETNKKIIEFIGQFVFEDDVKEELLNQAKEEKLKENDKLRDEALKQGVYYKNILFDSDTDQKVNLLAMLTTLGDMDTITWFGMDNQSLECSKLDLIEIGNLITTLHNFVWNRNAFIKGEIEKAETLEELENIEIDYDFVKEVKRLNGEMVN